MIGALSRLHFLKKTSFLLMFYFISGSWHISIYNFYMKCVAVSCCSSCFGVSVICCICFTLGNCGLQHSNTVACVVIFVPLLICKSEKTDDNMSICMYLRTCTISHTHTHTHTQVRTHVHTQCQSSEPSTPCEEC